MIRSAAIGLVCIATMVGAGSPVDANTQQASSVDLTGTWQLDAKRSDQPRGGPPPGMTRGGGGRIGGGPGGGMGGGGFGRRGGGMRGGGPGGPSGAEGESRRRGLVARLPEHMHVTQTPTLVSFEDSSGAVIQEIATVAAEADTFMQAPGAEHFAGRWVKGKLEVERPGPFEDPIQEIYALEADGKRLVVRIRLPGSERMPAREIKRVYQRLEGAGS